MLTWKTKLFDQNWSYVHFYLQIYIPAYHCTERLNVFSWRSCSHFSRTVNVHVINNIGKLLMQKIFWINWECQNFISLFIITVTSYIGVHDGVRVKQNYYATSSKYQHWHVWIHLYYLQWFNKKKYTRFSSWNLLCRLIDFVYS